MKKISDLYDCDLNISINGIKNNSKLVENGDLFVCTTGVTADRHDYIDEAIKNGASCLVVEKESDYKVPFIKVNNTNHEFGKICKKFYDNPLDTLKLIGVTGTDGKTTTSSIIRNMLGTKKCGYIGTNGVFCNDNVINIENTTPEINDTYKYLDMFKSNGMEYVAMEMSSEGFLHNRTNTLEVDIAIFTNITEDHLNVHKDIENYISCKEKIFELLKDNSVIILNRDDLYFERLSKKSNSKLVTYGKNIASDLIIIEIKEYDTGTIFTFSYKEVIYKVISPLIGEHNVYNLCAAILALVELGYEIEEVIRRVSFVESVNGRGEFLEFGQNYKIILDYAHTVNGLKNILNYLNKIKKGKIITVTGSAGGREKQKRKYMGDTVLTLSDLVVFTMDDPRNENVENIISDLISSTNKTNYIKKVDRKKAIHIALSLAKKDDIVLVVGKGRDNYMAVKNKKISYSDFESIKSYFE